VLGWGFLCGQASTFEQALSFYTCQHQHQNAGLQEHRGHMQLVEAPSDDCTLDLNFDLTCLSLHCRK